MSALSAGRAPSNFRIMRFAAASAVIFSHGYILTGGAAAIAQDPLKRLTGVDSGELAVYVFFAISGYLVSRSLVQRGSVLDFLAARALRITPGLTVSVLLGAFVLGPLVTDLPLGVYFATKRLYSYVLINSLSLSPFHFRYELPGVFEHLPVPGVVDAPLWTLPWEIWMYGALLALFLLRALGRAFPVVLSVLLGVYAVVALGGWAPDIFSLIAVRFLAFFFAGVAMQRYAERVTISVPIFVGLTVIFAAVSVATRSTVLLPEWLAYAVVFVAYSPRLVIARLSEGADLSYGMYIYAYMVQQTLVWAFGPGPAVINAGLGLILTLPIAAGSWYLVERPMLRLKARLPGRRRPD